MFSGSLIALVTPFTKSGTIDFLCFRSLCRFHKKAGTDGLVLIGTTGESPTLSKEEKLKLVSIALEEVNGAFPVIVGCGSNNTYQSIEEGKAYKAMGADGLMAIVPYYNKPNEKGCIAHFSAINEVGLPTIVYHHPGRTGIKLSLRSLKAILELENMVCIKECSGDLNYWKNLSSYGLLCGNDLDALNMLRNGAVGSISVIGNLFPMFWKKVVQSGNKTFFEQLKPLLQALELDVNPQPIKYAMSLLGLCEDIFRLPLLCCDEEVKVKIKSAMDEFEGLALQNGLESLLPDQDSVQLNS